MQEQPSRTLKPKGVKCWCGDAAWPTRAAVNLIRAERRGPWRQHARSLWAPSPQSWRTLTLFIQTRWSSDQPTCCCLWVHIIFYSSVSTKEGTWTVRYWFQNIHNLRGCKYWTSLALKFGERWFVASTRLWRTDFTLKRLEFLVLKNRTFPNYSKWSLYLTQRPLVSLSHTSL